MPVELQIIRASEFIRVDSHGRMNLQASKTRLAELARLCRQRGIHRALLDLRDKTSEPAPAFAPVQLASIVNTFANMGFSNALRLAVLYGADPHHRARMFAFISRQHGWNVKAFDDYEKALDWLALAKEPVQAAD